MDASPHSQQDWEALADAGSRLAGALDAACFDRRVAAALAMGREEGQVDYALDFQRLPNGAVGVRGRLHAELIARCQRCLEPFDLVLDLAPRLAFSSADSEPAPGEDWEPVEAGFPPSLAALIEEELLLGLPFAPRHANDGCAAAAAGPTPKAEVQRPFAGLGDALKSRRNRGD